MLAVRQIGALLLLCLAVYSPLSVAQTVANYSNFWWNPEQNGMGLNVEHQGNTVALVWFLYGGDSQPTFLTATCELTKILGKDGCRAVLNRTSGPQLSNYNPDGVFVQLTPPGEATISFDGPDKAALEFSYLDLDGTTQRGVYNVVPMKLNSAVTQGHNFTNFWWDTQKSGMGVGTLHQGRTLAGVWYHYGQFGRPTFLVWSCTLVTDSFGLDQCDARFRRPSGPPPQNYDPARFRSGEDAGAVRIRFEKPRLADFTVNAISTTGTLQSGRMALTPFVFGPKYFSPSLIIAADDRQAGDDTDWSMIDLGAKGRPRGVLVSSSYGCVGVDINPVTDMLHVMCKDRYTFGYNLRTRAIRSGPIAGWAQAEFPTVGCGLNGLCVYGYGVRGNFQLPATYTLVNPDYSVQAWKVFPPDIGGNRIPASALARGNAVFLLSIGPTGTSSGINRFDTVGRRFEFGVGADDAFIEMGAEANPVAGMAIVADTLFVAIKRGQADKDVLAFDAVTGSRRAAMDIALPDGVQGQFNAYSLSASITHLYVATRDGVRAYQPTASGGISATGMHAAPQRTAIAISYVKDFIIAAESNPTASVVDLITRAWFGGGYKESLTGQFPRTSRAFVFE